MMAGMNGIDLAIHFRTAHPLCRILLFSGQARTANLLEETRIRGYDFGLLPKPVHPANLLATLRVNNTRESLCYSSRFSPCSIGPMLLCSICDISWITVWRAAV
jgi:DNA-binding response OmpR family regulator